VLVAAIALVITFAGTQMWGVVCFVAFRFQQSAIGDHIYHHVQAALRDSSSSSPAFFVVRVLEIIFSQRAHHLPHSPPITARLIRDFDNHSHSDFNHPHNASSGKSTREKAKGAFGSTLARLSCLLGLAAGFSAAFTTISLLGAQFCKAADNSALVASHYCGWPAEVSDLYDLATPEAKDTSTLLLVPGRARYRRCRGYARSCYAEKDDGELSKQCDAFVTRRIASILTMDKTCPFPGAGVCKTDSVRIESGRIDSRDMLGINTPDKDRVGVKKSLTCVPIDADQWATEWLDGASWGFVEGDAIKGYAVGTLRGEQSTQPEYPFVATQYYSLFGTEPYPLESVSLTPFLYACFLRSLRFSCVNNYIRKLMGDRWQTFMPGNDTPQVSSFTPRDDLKVADGDLTLMALSPRAFFDEEIPDPWFNVTVPGPGSSGSEAWIAPLGHSIVGCLERYQFCASEFCSQPSALYQLRASSTYGLDRITADQKAVADLVWKSLWAAQLQYALLFMGNEILVANEQVMGNWYLRSSKIPSNQWTIEAWNLANISFAVLQRRPGDYATPVPVLRGDPSRIIQPETDAARALCQQIKIRTTMYTSFRVLSLVLLAALAAIMTTLNRTLPYFFSKVSSHSGWKREAAEWDEYDIFHLIRSVCEARGIGPWDGREKAVPTMRERHRKFSLHAGGWDVTADASPGY
jgi:hypothetical protein